MNCMLVCFLIKSKDLWVLDNFLPVWQKKLSCWVQYLSPHRPFLYTAPQASFVSDKSGWEESHFALLIGVCWYDQRQVTLLKPIQASDVKFSAFAASFSLAIFIALNRRQIHVYLCSTTALLPRSSALWSGRIDTGHMKPSTGFLLQENQ